MFKIAFRTDASIIIGKGHVMRCLTLAHYVSSIHRLKDIETEIIFITTPHYGNLNNFIEEQGYRVISLPRSTWEMKAIDTNSWLGRTQEQDAQFCIDNISTPLDLLIIDHYAIDKTWHQLMRATYNKLMVIDDLANKEYDCDILLDQTLSRKATDYKDLTPKNCKILTGINYTLLRDEFISQRRIAQKKRQRLTSLPCNFHVLISLGGFDPDNVSKVAIKALIKLYSTVNPFTATIVLASQSSHVKSISNLISEHSWITLELDSQKMSELMLNADIAVGASGSTAWERCCLGLPTLSIETADNQKLVSKALQQQGAIINLGESNNINETMIHNALINILPQTIKAHTEDVNNIYKTMVKQCFSCCDGKGVERVYRQALSDLFPAQEINLSLATQKDVDTLFKWQSDSRIRQYFRNPKPVEYSEHCSWFNAIINDNSRHIFIINKNSHPVGMIRLDEDKNNEFEISILVDPVVQGKKVAATALTKIIKMYPQRVINAFVNLNNNSSHRLFTQAKFTKIDSEKYCLRPTIAGGDNQ